MQLQANLIDLDRVYKSIDGLTNIEKDKVIKQGLRNASAVFIRAGRNNLRSRMKKNHTGNLMKSFRTKVKRLKLGSLAGFDGFGPHAHLVDEGTTERYTRKGSYRGKVTGNHFWTDAVDTNKNIAINKVYEGIERAVNKILSR